MPRPCGCDHATHVKPVSDNDKPQTSPTKAVLHPPTILSLDTMDFFQRMVLLTESTNALKHCVNVEKQSHCDNPAYLELVSSDEEEFPLPISSVPLVPLPSMGTVPVLITNEPDSLPTCTTVPAGPPNEADPTIATHIPTPP